MLLLRITPSCSCCGRTGQSAAARSMLGSWQPVFSLLWTLHASLALLLLLRL
jgi:hypothetical protein